MLSEHFQHTFYYQTGFSTLGSENILIQADKVISGNWLELRESCQYKCFIFYCQKWRVFIRHKWCIEGYFITMHLFGSFTHLTIQYPLTIFHWSIREKKILKQEMTQSVWRQMAASMEKVFLKDFNENYFSFLDLCSAAIASAKRNLCRIAIMFQDVFCLTDQLLQ